MSVAVGGGRGVGIARGSREVTHRGGRLAVGGDRSDEAGRPSGAVLVCVDGPVVMVGVGVHGGGGGRWLLVVVRGGRS